MGSSSCFTSTVALPSLVLFVNFISWTVRPIMSMKLFHVNFLYCVGVHATVNVGWHKMVPNTNPRYTGRVQCGLVAAHCTRHVPWGISGKNVAKIPLVVREGLGGLYPTFSDTVPIYLNLDQHIIHFGLKSSTSGLTLLKQREDQSSKELLQMRACP